MKVAILYNTAWYIYIFRRNLIQELQARGATVFAICPVDEYVPKLESLGVTCHPIRLRSRNVNPLVELTAVRDIMQSLKAIAPDYVLSFTVKCNLYAGLCNYFVRFRQVANVSGLGEVFDRRGVLNTTVRFLYRIGLAKARTVFFQNREDLRTCVDGRLVPEAASQLIPGSGVDLTRFAPEPAVAQDDSKRRSFLMFGRLLPLKGYDSYLMAAKALKALYGDRVSFSILGKPDHERPESIALFERIRAADAEGTVRYHEPTDNVLPILREADVVVLPSTYNEGVPRSLLEALACGKAIVTTDWKGCRDTVRDGWNGFLVPPRNDAALTKALETFVLMESDTLAAFGAKSRELAETEFDERLVLTRYLQSVGYEAGAEPAAAVAQVVR